MKLSKLTSFIISAGIAGAVCTSTAEALSPYTPFPIAWQQRETAGAENHRLSYIPEEPNWCDYPWNRGDETGNTVGDAGCSLFSFLNIVFYRTGRFISPTELAQYALEKDYRTVGVDGVQVDFFKAAVTDYAADYGMSYDGYSKSAEEVLAHIREGGFSSSNVYGHWIAIVDYSEEKDLYLILDSCQDCVRCKNIEWTDRGNGIAWLTPEELLEEGKSGYYGIEKRYSALYSFDYIITADKGDADGNGELNIGDALSVLIYYAEGSVGRENLRLHPHPELNEKCLIAADFDENGEINISDAGKILMEYANRSVGVDN